MDNSIVDTQIGVEGGILMVNINHYIRAWQHTFPAPSRPAFPEDFNTQERSQMRQFVMEFVKDKENGVDVYDMADSAVDSQVNILMEMNDFPIQIGRIPTVITALFKEVCNQKRRNLKGRKRPLPIREQEAATSSGLESDTAMDTAEEAGGAVGSGAQNTADSGGKSKGKGKGKGKGKAKTSA